MTQYVEHLSNKVRALFGQPIEQDDEGAEEFVFGSNNGIVTPTGEKPNLSYQEKNLEANRQRELLFTLGYGPGAIVARKQAREQVKNPWTWGIVIFLTKTLPSDEIIRPLGVVWLSDGSNRGITTHAMEDVILVSSPPPKNILNALLSGAV